MRIGRSLSDAKIDVLNALYKLRYATVVQVAYWADESRHQSRSYAHIAALVDSGLVSKHDALQPHIYSLSREGYKAIAEKAPPGSRQESWSVLTHQCHTNVAEIKLREHFSGFQFMPKKTLYSMGINPAIAEHCSHISDDYIYVLVDDYYMSSDRLGRVKTRPHRPKCGYLNINSSIKTWNDLATMFICVATVDTQYAAHKAYLKANKLDFSMLKIEALW